MSQYGKTGEQSMEEILASIRSSVDAPESASTVQDIPQEAGNGVGRSGVPDVPAHNGGSRLQDALLNAGSASPGQATQQVLPPTGLKSVPKAPPAPTPVSAAPTRTNNLPPRDGNPNPGDDDLSDLFADSTLAANVPPSETAKKISAATFGITTMAPETPKPIVSGTPLSPEQAAALVKPASVSEAKPERLEHPAAPAASSSAPDVAASTPTPSPSSAHVQGHVEPKPKREPSFAALKTLASGTTSTIVTSSEDSPEAADAPSVLLPEMRDLPNTNPVAQMHSMAAGASLSNDGGFISNAGGFIPATRPSEPNDANLADAQPENSVVETSGTPSPAMTSTPENSGNGITGEIAPGAHVEATTRSRSLEDIVVELLKPQLSKWLEANMPRIVERALRAEQSGSSDKESS